MRLSRTHFATLRDTPSDGDVVSYELMVKAGMLVKLAAGLYTYGPLLWRSLQKIRRIVTEEMDRAGAVEMCMPILQPLELWTRSGRLENYTRSRILWQATDRKDASFALGPTHEEVITDFAARTVSSYRQLPLTLYQVQTKFRDELRPRFGLMRCREFLMKDAYSFDRDEEGLDRSYQIMREAYRRIFSRMGLDFVVVQADAGDIGGTGSEEFMVTADTGEDLLLSCTDTTCGYGANVETARSAVDDPHDAPPEPLRHEPTPNVKTVAELCAFFPELTPARMVKTILYEVTQAGQDEPETVAVLMRGDQEINETKLLGALGALEVKLADDETVRRVTGAAVGFAGPLGFLDDSDADYSIRVLADESVQGMTNFLCGCNRTDVHCLDVNFGRDLPEPHFLDLRKARAGEPCPRCGAPLAACRGIEVGHVFKLGTKYSKAMEATFLDETGRAQPFVMGCYGIGVSRIAAALVEQRHDEAGMIWPAAIAPYHVHLVALNMKKDEIRQACETVYEALLAHGVEVLYDDRPGLSAGVKFADADLLGLPWRINVGRTVSDGQVELVERATGERTLVAIDAVAETLAPLCLVPERPTLLFPDPDTPATR